MVSKYPYIVSIFIVYVVFGVLSSIPTHAQDFVRDIERLNNAYYKRDLKFTIHSVTEHKESGESKTENIKVKMRATNHFYMESGELKVLITPKVKVVVNEHDMTLFIDSIRNNIYDQPIPMALFDTIAKVYKSIEYSNITTGKSRYTLVPKTGNPTKIVIDFDPIKMVVLRVQVDYLDLNLGLKLTKVNTYKYSNFVISELPVLSNYYYLNSKGIVTQSTPFKDYELISFIQIK